MDYNWLKALHVASVLIWIAGLMVSAAAVTVFWKWKKPISDDGIAILDLISRWDRVVTSPAMLSLWIFGFWTASQGDWFSSRWLQFKLILVVILSGLHGFLSGTLKRLKNRRTKDHLQILRFSMPIVSILATVIAILAVVKPF